MAESQEDIQTRIEHQVKVGALEFEEAPVEEKEEAEATSYKIGEDEYTKDQILEWKNKAENEEKWRKTYTQGQQSVAQERKEIEKEKADWENKIAAMRETVKGDDVLERNLDIMEESRRELDRVKGELNQYKQKNEAETQRELLNRHKAEAESKLGITLPSIDSDEFKALMSPLANNSVNYVELMAKEAGLVKRDKPKPAGRPGTSEIGQADEDDDLRKAQRAVMRKAGIDPSRLKEFAN